MILQSRAHRARKNGRRGTKPVTTIEKLYSAEMLRPEELKAAAAGFLKNATGLGGKYLVLVSNPWKFALFGVAGCKSHRFARLYATRVFARDARVDNCVCHVLGQCKRRGCDCGKTYVLGNLRWDNTLWTVFETLPAERYSEKQLNAFTVEHAGIWRWSGEPAPLWCKEVWSSAKR
jgi:hypothetical protein